MSKDDVSNRCGFRFDSLAEILIKNFLLELVDQPRRDFVADPLSERERAREGRIAQVKIDRELVNVPVGSFFDRVDRKDLRVENNCGLRRVAHLVFASPPRRPVVFLSRFGSDRGTRLSAARAVRTVGPMRSVRTVGSMRSVGAMLRDGRAVYGSTQKERLLVSSYQLRLRFVRGFRQTRLRFVYPCICAIHEPSGGTTRVGN